MRRLVYSPKVNAFIRTDTGIIDISDFIVRGTVTRVVNEVSTAEITLRNPNKRFTKPGSPTFRPMDAITIFLSRFENHPVQVFTGYLDSTPYLQLFPGTCTVRASCTLKRLLHTYWDPGLYFSNQWLIKHGWLPDPQTGQVLRVPKSVKIPDGWLPTPQQVSDYLDKNKLPKIEPGNVTGADRKKYAQKVWDSLNQKDNPNATLQSVEGEMTDSGFGELMNAALQDIGNWDKNEIFIEEIPQSMVETSVSFLKNVLQNSEPLGEDTEANVKQFVERMIGPYNAGSSTGGSNLQTGDFGGAGPPTGAVVAPVDVGRAMITVNFPADVTVIAEGIGVVNGESGFDGKAVNDSSGASGYWQLLGEHPACHDGIAPYDTYANLLKSTRIAHCLWQYAGNTFASDWTAYSPGVGAPYTDAARKAIELGPFTDSPKKGSGAKPTSGTPNAGSR